MARAARAVWSVITCALLLGVFELLRAATWRTRAPWHAAAIGTASLALVPIFMRWSLHVRTDQPAAACAVWAGVALLASARRPALAAVAGVLVGTGYLFSQKAIYLASLAGLLALGDHYIGQTWRWRREVVRGALVAAGALVALGAYRLTIARWYVNPGGFSAETGLGLLDWYRWLLRWRLYPNMVSSVIPHLGLLALVFVAALRAFRRGTPERRPLTIALLVVLLGIAVGRFHTASFPYFWITIGVFPATAIALGWEGIRELMPRAAPPLTGAAWAMMIALGVHARAETLEDTQRVQLDSFAFVDRALPATMRGFHADGALICRGDPNPLPVFLGQNVAQTFGDEHAAEHAAAFIEQFRTRPVAFLVRTPRLAAFPPEVRAFWAQHYVPYAGTTEVAGVKTIAGEPARTFDVIVPGAYRWWGRGTVAVGGSMLVNGGVVALAAGAITVAPQDAQTEGTLALSVGTPPAPSAVPFYDDISVLEMMGARRKWW